MDSELYKNPIQNIVIPDFVLSYLQPFFLQILLRKLLTAFQINIKRVQILLLILTELILNLRDNCQ